MEEVGGELEGLVAGGGGFGEPGADGERGAGVVGEAGGVEVEEVPVEVLEGAGARAGAVGGGEVAVGAVIAHSVDVSCAGGVGFSGEEAAVGVKSHAEDVACHDPIVGVDEHSVEPVEGLGRGDGGEEAEVAEEHEALDVVIEAGVEEVAEGAVEAVEGGVGVPKEGWEGAVGVEGVGRGIIGHECPINAVDEFAPSEDLADEAFDGGERCEVFGEGVEGGVDALEWAEEAEVEARG